MNTGENQIFIAFRNELNGYRNKLAQNYLTNPHTKVKFRKEKSETGCRRTVLACSDARKSISITSGIKEKWKKDMINTKSNNYPSLIVINRIIEPSPLPLEEVKAEMMAGYQDFLESEWLGQLREKYPVSIDNGVFEELTKQTDNE